MTQRLPPQHGALHRFFEASLLLKGAFAAFEASGGLALLAAPTQLLQRWLDWLTRSGLIEHPNDPIIRRLLAALGPIDAASQHFYAIYLLGHGTVKLAVVILLARRISWAYPLGMVVLGGFIAYQLHRWQHSGSPVMLLLSALDAVIVWLTWREWSAARNAPAQPG